MGKLLVEIGGEMCDRICIEELQFARDTAEIDISRFENDTAWVHPDDYKHAKKRLKAVNYLLKYWWDESLEVE